MTTTQRLAGTFCRLVTLIILFAGAPAAAQSPTTGVVRGIVLDEFEEPLGDVLVTLVSRATGAQREGSTDRQGAYSFPFVAPGEYDIVIERLGYVPVRVVALRVTPGGSVQLATTLASAPSPAVAIDTITAAAAGAARFGGRDLVPGEGKGAQGG
jgi:hypothetical protein